MRIRSTNPVYGRISRMSAEYAGTYAQATYKGVAGKTLYYMLLVLAGGIGGILLLERQADLLRGLILVSGITGSISAIIAFVSPRATKVVGTIYCLSQGLIVGLVSYILEALIPGVVPIAILGTMSVVIVAAALYLTGIVKVTRKFTRFLILFSLSVFVTIFLAGIFSLFSATIRDAFLSPGVNILVSLIMIFIATLYILFDLENIRQVVEGSHPKFMEWFAAFGLAFTVVWLYMEILPLVAQILMSRD